MHTSIMCIQSPETTDIDICAFITRDATTNHVDSQYTYFCRDRYPPPTPEELEMFNNPPSLEKLSRDLYNTSYMAGFHLIMDGDS